MTFDYRAPDSLEEVLSLLSEHGDDARLLAGGTALVILMKQRLVRSITQLCREHGVMVIGEGVETAAEAECLTELGCDLLQGYLIARPGPPFVDP